MPDDATERLATHSSRLQPSIICMPQLQPWCSAALVPKFTTLKSGMNAQDSLESTIEPRDLVYYFGLEPVLHGRKGKVLPLDHQCLLEYQEKSWTVLLMEYNSLNIAQARLTLALATQSSIKVWYASWAIEIFFCQKQDLEYHHL